MNQQREVLPDCDHGFVGHTRASLEGQVGDLGASFGEGDDGLVAHLVAGV